MWKKIKSLSNTFRKEIIVYRGIIADPRCPRAARWLLGGAVAYAVSPVDLIPDFIPVIGHLDDLVIVPLLVWLAMRSIPAELIEEHRRTGRRPGTDTDHSQQENHTFTASSSKIS